MLNLEPKPWQGWRVLPRDHGLLALGSNLPSSVHGDSRQVLAAALENLSAHRVEIIATAENYETEPDPPSDQPKFINSAALVRTSLTPPELLHQLHRIEADFGRRRNNRNEARILDLDLLAFGEQITRASSETDLSLPHPRLHLRSFVLRPLHDLVPNWQHPTVGKTIQELCNELNAK